MTRLRLSCSAGHTWTPLVSDEFDRCRSLCPACGEEVRIGFEKERPHRSWDKVIQFAQLVQQAEAQADAGDLAPLL